MSNVDVEAVLTKLAAESKEKLDWRKSIVDLMKLLKLDSSFGARKELAKELGYTGDIERFGVDEHLAAQAGDAETRRERRQGARRPQVGERAVRVINGAPSGALFFCTGRRRTSSAADIAAPRR